MEASDHNNHPELDEKLEAHQSGEPIIVEGEIVEDEDDTLFFDLDENNDIEEAEDDNAPLVHPAKRKRGRRDKLNKKLYDKAKKALLAGNYHEVVYKYVGISKNTWYRWLKMGEEDAEAGRTSKYRDFFEMVEECSVFAEVTASAIVVGAMKDDPRLALEFLSRRAPQRWGRKIVETSQEGNNDTGIDPETQAQIAKQLNTLNSFLEAAQRRAALSAPDEGKES